LARGQSALVAQAQPVAFAVQPPCCSEQLSAVQAMPSSHVMLAPPHLPLVQTSVEVHVSPSLHDAPSGLGGLVHLPSLAGSHTPATWQPSEALHTFCPDGVQAPF
jgi:hypothetical protein